MMGNKGAAAISFKYSGYNFLMISCHLAAGQKSNKQRNSDFNRINYSLKIGNVVGKQEDMTSISDKSDVCIWAGDFNYRINLNLEEVHDSLLTTPLEGNLNYDQFFQQIEQENVDFDHFNEARINFYPTYKFIPNTDDYDLGSKQPGWTDRIIFKTNRESQFSILRYSWIKSVKFSDHRPVCADFIFNVEKPNFESKPNIKLVDVDEKSKTCSIF